MARAAGDGERHDNAVAFFEVGHAGTYFLYNAHELVAHDHRFGLRDESVVDVEVGAANGRRRHFKDHIPVFLDARIIDSIYAHFFRVVEY